MQYKVTGRVYVDGFAVHYSWIGTSDGFVHAGEIVETPEGADGTVPIVVHDGDNCRVFPGNAEEVERMFQAGFLEVC